MHFLALSVRLPLALKISVLPMRTCRHPLRHKRVAVLHAKSVVTHDGYGNANRFVRSKWRQKVLSQSPSNDDDAASRAELSRQSTNLAMFAAPFCSQLGAVLRVQWLYWIRDVAVMRTRMFMYLFFGILVGTMYWQLDYGQVREFAHWVCF